MPWPSRSSVTSSAVADDHDDGELLTEDDDGDVDGAEHTELVRLLEEPVLALEGPG